MPDRIVVYLNEQKVSKLASAAILADEFVLTHRTVFSTGSEEKTRQPAVRQSLSLTISPKKEEREYFYCHKPGHLISNCLALKRKQQSVSNPSQTKGVGLVKAAPHTSATSVSETPDVRFQPFIFNGVVSLTGEPGENCSVRILRDTGCS